MKRRLALSGLLALAITFVAWPAPAALRDVAVGNFYYDDATPGDGTVEATQGDQLRFTVYDGGPGTPHTVEVDELNIHSGSLAAGETYTTPPLNQPGSFRLYCKPHQNRGHVATLVVRAGTTASTPAPTTAPRPTVSGTASTTTAAPIEAPVDGGVATTVPPEAPNDGDRPEPTLAPVGRGAADPDTLAAAPVDPNSLEATLGRRPGKRGPWTRSLRMALLALIPMVAAATVAALRGRTIAPPASPPPR